MARWYVLAVGRGVRGPCAGPFSSHAQARDLARALATRPGMSAVRVLSRTALASAGFPRSHRGEYDLATILFENHVVLTS